MRAVRLVRPGQALEAADVPVPQMDATDVLVRVIACGICHSDAHYRAGTSKIDNLPVTLGHEVAGVVESVGDDVTDLVRGARVCLHYLVSCGSCDFCSRGQEQFCRRGQMIGKHRDGGYAEFIKVPARNAFVLPDKISFETGAVMMCSSATALHALRKARFQSGESLALFGFGGLGFSALQLAQIFGARVVYAVEINRAKLAAISTFGGVAIDATSADPVAQIKEATDGAGVNVAIDFVGSTRTMQQAVQCLSVSGRAALVALSDETLSVPPYPDLINKEAEIIGVSDHLASELPLLIQLVREGKLQFPLRALRVVDLDAEQINAALDALETLTDVIRTVVRISRDEPLAHGVASAQQPGKIDNFNA